VRSRQVKEAEDNPGAVVDGLAGAQLLNNSKAQKLFFGFGRALPSSKIPPKSPAANVPFRSRLFVSAAGKKTTT